MNFSRKESPTSKSLTNRLRLGRQRLISFREKEKGCSTASFHRAFVVSRFHSTAINLDWTAGDKGRERRELLFSARPSCEFARSRYRGKVAKLSRNCARKAGGIIAASFPTAVTDNAPFEVRFLRSSLSRSERTSPE